MVYTSTCCKLQGRCQEVACGPGVHVGRQPHKNRSHAKLSAAAGLRSPPAAVAHTHSLHRHCRRSTHSLHRHCHDIHHQEYTTHPRLLRPALAVDAEVDHAGGPRQQQQAKGQEDGRQPNDGQGVLRSTRPTQQGVRRDARSRTDATGVRPGAAAQGLAGCICRRQRGREVLARTFRGLAPLRSPAEDQYLHSNGDAVSVLVSGARVLAHRWCWGAHAAPRRTGPRAALPQAPAAPRLWQPACATECSPACQRACCCHSLLWLLLARDLLLVLLVFCEAAPARADRRVTRGAGTRRPHSQPRVFSGAPRRPQQPPVPAMRADGGHSVACACRRRGRAAVRGAVRPCGPGQSRPRTVTATQDGLGHHAHAPLAPVPQWAGGQGAAAPGRRAAQAAGGRLCEGGHGDQCVI